MPHQDEDSLNPPPGCVPPIVLEYLNFIIK